MHSGASFATGLGARTLRDFLRGRMYEQFELNVVRISKDQRRTPGGVHDPGVSHTATVEMLNPVLQLFTVRHLQREVIEPNATLVELLLPSPFVRHH